MLYLLLHSGLLYCMEYLEENLEEWMSAELDGYGDEDYLVFDCPGQVGVCVVGGGGTAQDRPWGRGGGGGGG